MTYRFLHSSDLHLGRAFGGFPEEIRGRLREARHTAIGRLAAAARANGASDILLAGDTFDAETPAPETLRHALQAMAAEEDLRWFLLPGNHDSLAATELWRRAGSDRPRNLVILSDAAPMALSEAAWLLPAPCTQRRPGRDLTEAMSAPVPEGALRIGLGHGAIMNFSSDEGSPGIIAPDRARLSGLDYLALGDWHGRMQTGDRSWYSGTPESDSFKHQTTPGALLVTLAGPGALPEVTTCATGQFRWHHLSPDVLPGDEAAADPSLWLPAAALRRDCLMRLEPQGRLTLAERSALGAALSGLAADFGWFEADLSRVGTDVKPDDLDMIERGGALRRAAEALLAEAEDASRSGAERELAVLALSRLYSLVQEIAS